MAAAPRPLRPRWGLFSAGLGVAFVAAGVLLIGNSPPGDAGADCALVAETARLVGLAPVFPRIGGSSSEAGADCQAALVAAGVPLAAERSARAAGGSPAPLGVAFARPRFIGGDRAVVDYSLLCGPLCGSGHRVELVRRRGRWEVVAQGDTWIS